MSKIIFFGTCAGTEPIEGMHHLSFAIERNNEYYFFDAGENCSRTAHLMGVDLLKVKTIFISHTHMDHIGGLGNLLWNIRKFSIVRNSMPINSKVDVYIPNMESWEGILSVLKNTEGDFVCDFDIESHTPTDGIIYQDNNIKVEAIHNHHIQPKNDKYLSYSYIIEIDKKKIAFSGDLGNMEDAERLIKNGCDYLLIETGHYKVDELLKLIENYDVKKILFVHNGREIINDIETVRNKLSKCEIPTEVCCDEMIIEI